MCCKRHVFEEIGEEKSFSWFNEDRTREEGINRRYPYWQRSLLERTSKLWMTWSTDCSEASHKVHTKRVV